MSSHVVVISTDLRRATVKVTPGTYLSDVLQEACTKLGLSSDKYLVKSVLPFSYHTSSISDYADLINLQAQ